ncbi:MAG: hypothetical protein HYX71_09345 [Opitutae bacterium]|nr:hypothetical protein [Opitutae bacterium]
MNRQKIFLLGLAGVAISCWYVARFEGEPKLIDPILVARLPETPGQWSQPALLQNIDEPTAIYIVAGLPGSDGLFDALRLDINSAARSSTRIRFGPHTAYIPFDSAEVTGFPVIEFHGVALRRPTLHLLAFPGPGGPGFHLVDSATGAVHIVAGTGNSRRTLLTRTVINSNRISEMGACLWVDNSRSTAAFLWQENAIWTLALFSLVPKQT